MPVEWQPAICALRQQLQALWAAGAATAPLFRLSARLQDAPPAAEPAAVLAPAAGAVDLRGGGAALQHHLDGQPQPLALVHFHAPWSHASREALPLLEALAQRHARRLVLYRLDVQASTSNLVRGAVWALTESVGRTLERRAGRHAG